MAINIFSGGAAKTAKTPRVSSAAERASATTSAISGPAVASDSGSTAVKSTGILGKIGSIVGKVAPVLGKILPGPAGMIANAIGNLTSANDPEWWQTVPGDGLTVNAPLAPVAEGDISLTADTGSVTMFNVRPTFLEFLSSVFDSTIGTNKVIAISDRMATQYLMPAVRKVTNAVVMQDATTYARVFEAQATMYALWRNLKKYDYFIKHGYTFVPNLNDPAFPVFQVANAAWLQTTITRLEEYLHSHVRLPHTLCEYLSWRYGRVFRTNNSAKAGFVFYNVETMNQTVGTLTNMIAQIQTYLSSTDLIQKAVADLYNAYQDHDQEVEMADASMIMYDSKEFCLRTNLDLISTYPTNPWKDVDQAPIIIDSNLDNPTVFMASTVSCVYDNTLAEMPLFPVYEASAFLAKADSTQDFLQYFLPYNGAGASTQAASGWQPIGASVIWLGIKIMPAVVGGSELFTSFTTVAALFSILHQIQAAKAMDFYNVGIFFTAKKNNQASVAAATVFIDQTSISMDMGSVPDLTIANEQVIAFANLVTEVHKHAETYKMVEKRVAKDVANFVESNEVAAMSSK